MSDLDILDVEPIDDEPAPHEPHLPALAPTGSLVLRPAASLTDLADAFRDYQRICAHLLDDSDYQQIYGGGRFRKKSGWRKLANFYGISLTIHAEATEYGPDGAALRSKFTVRAEAPNGRVVDGWGSCERYERCCQPGCKRNHTHCNAAKERGKCRGWTHFSKSDHDIPATACTRAYNRAVSDMLGLGEVSAEEVLQAERDEALAASEIATETERADMQARILALATDTQAELRAMWPPDLPGLKNPDLRVIHLEQIGGLVLRMERQEAGDAAAAKKRAQIVAIACGEVDTPFEKDDVRHAIVHHATAGRTASGREVTSGEVDAVRKTCAAVRAGSLRVAEVGGAVQVVAAAG